MVGEGRSEQNRAAWVHRGEVKARVVGRVCFWGGQSRRECNRPGSALSLHPAVCVASVRACNTGLELSKNLLSNQVSGGQSEQAGHGSRGRRGGAGVER